MSSSLTFTSLFNPYLTFPALLSNEQEILRKLKSFFHPSFSVIKELRNLFKEKNHGTASTAPGGTEISRFKKINEGTNYLEKYQYSQERVPSIGNVTDANSISFGDSIRCKPPNRIRASKPGYFFCISRERERLDCESQSSWNRIRNRINASNNREPGHTGLRLGSITNRVLSKSESLDYSIVEHQQKPNKLNKRQLQEFSESGINPDYASFNFKNAPKGVIKGILNPEGKPNLDFTFEENEYLGGWLSVHGESFKPFKPSEGLKYYTLEKGCRLYEVIHPPGTVIDNRKVKICEGAKKAVSVAQKYRCRVFYFQSIGHALGCINEIVELARKYELYLCLDNDFKAKPLQQALKLIKQIGMQIPDFKVSSFMGKGIDDAIAEGNDITWVDKFHWRPRDSSKWDFIENSRYLSPIEFPKGTRCVVLRSAKGTGKSYQLALLAAKAKKEGRPIIVITHRINLSRALAKEFDIPYIDDASYQEGGSVALCINSIQKIKQSNLHGAYVIFDECDQVLHDLMKSQTMMYKRAKILETLRTLGKKIVDEFKGTFFLASADVDSNHIAEYKKLLSIPDERMYKIKNEYEIPKGDCLIYYYNNPKENYFYKQLHKLLEKDKKVYVALAAQKVVSKFSTQNVERYINEVFPHLKVLRIDSETVGDSLNPAYRAPEKIKALCLEYDVVIASPTLGTGVDINFKGKHVFDAVVAHSSGRTCDINSLRQALSRVRDFSIPRYVFCPAFIRKDDLNPIDRITNMREFEALKKEEFNQLEKADPAFLEKWFDEYCVKHDEDAMNYFFSDNQLRLKEISNYAGLLSTKLKQEGYQIDFINSGSAMQKDEWEISMANPEYETKTDKIKKIKLGADPKEITKEATLEYHTEIANCAEITDEKYEELCQLQSTNHAEKLLIESHKIRRRWGLHPTIEIQKKESGDYMNHCRKLALATDLFDITQACLESYNYDFNQQIHIAHDEILSSSYYSGILAIKENRETFIGREFDEQCQLDIVGLFGDEDQQELHQKYLEALKNGTLKPISEEDKKAKKRPKDHGISMKQFNVWLHRLGLSIARYGKNPNYRYLIKNNDKWGTKLDLGEANEGINFRDHVIENTQQYLEKKLKAWREVKRDIVIIDEAKTLDAKENADTRSLNNKYTKISTRAKCLAPLPEMPIVRDAALHKEEFLASLRSPKIALDTETYSGNDKEFGDDYDYDNPDDILWNQSNKKGGLNPIDGRIRLASVYDGKNLWVVQASDLSKHFKDEFKEMLANPNQTKILHNSMFDLRFLRWQGFIEATANISDTMLGSRCLWGDMGAAKVTAHSLKQLMKHLFNKEIDKQQQNSDWGSPSLSREQIEYAAGDAFFTYHAHERLIEVCCDPSILGLPFPKNSALEHWKIRNNSIPGILQMQSTGYIVSEKKEAIRIERQECLNKLLAKWDELCPDITPNQVARIKDFIFKKYGVTLPSLSSKDVVGENEFPETKLRQQIVSLQRDLLLIENTVEPGNQQPLILGLVSGTGRCSSGMSKVSKRFFNFHSIPKKANKSLKEFKLMSLREMFTTNCIIDLPGSHGRIAAELAGDEYAIERFMNPDLDLHSETGAILAKICFPESKAKQYTSEFIKANQDNKEKPYCKQLRSAAKNTYYGWLNGAGASTIKKQIQANMGIEVSKSACQQALTDLKANFAATVEYAQSCLEILENPDKQYIMDGKIFGFMLINDTYLSWQLGKVGHSIGVPATKAFACIWSLVESLLMNKALAKIHNKFQENPQWKASLQNFIHDEFNLLYEDIEAAKFAYETVKGEFGKICKQTAHIFDPFEKCVEGIHTCADK